MMLHKEEKIINIYIGVFVWVELILQAPNFPGILLILASSADQYSYWRWSWEIHFPEFSMCFSHKYI